MLADIGFMYLAAFFGFLAGFALCAVLTAGKITDLQAQVCQAGQPLDDDPPAAKELAPPIIRPQAPADETLCSLIK